MEEEIPDETWAWMDDDFKLDTESPLAISRSLWDDFTSSEAVARSLFPSTPCPHSKDLALPAICFRSPESLDRRSAWEVIPECSPSPLKRRYLLRVWDEDMTNSSLCKNDNEFGVGTCEDSHVTGLSLSNSSCYITTEESHSSVDDAVEQSAESWMVGCFSDSDTSEIQEIPPPLAVDSQISAATSQASLERTGDGAALKSRTLKNVPSKLAPMSKSKQKGSSGQVGVMSRAHVTSSHGGHAKEHAKPVLAYPFTLVKPSGIQGDVTLQDINHRIKMAPSKPRAGSKDSYRTSSASPLSGKAVVGLTKIQTGGKGTITILRTRT